MEVNRCFGCMEETASVPCPHCGYDPKAQIHQSFVLRPGTILCGKYLMGRVLGQGGFGITYIGWDLVLSQKVAIKEYFPSAYVTRHSDTGSELHWYITEQAREMRSKGREMFLKEARKMNRVSSIPDVVHVLDLFEDNQTAYIVMKFIQGENLMQRIEQNGPLPWQTVKKLLLPVVDTMQKVHNAGLIHRDLSPDNLMLQPDGSVKILDLGAAKDLNLHSGASSMQVAKSGFSPLEQYVQRGGSGTWTDVYALAATTYYALTGVIPPSVMDRVDRDSLRWDLPQLKNVPAGILEVLKKGMALHIDDRIQTMDAFAAGINGAGHSVKSRKNHTGKIIAAVAAVAIVCTLGLGSIFGRASDSGEEGPYRAGEGTEAQTQDIALLNESEVPWGSNVLVSHMIPEPYQYDMDEAPVFNSRISRCQIISVTFLDSVENAGSDSWDVSHNRDGSVLAWTEKNGVVSVWDGDKNVEKDGYDLYIAANGGINGKYCSNLFAGFNNVKSIMFNGCFHTDYAESMESMVYGCYSLEELDVRELETGMVRNMFNMFANCGVRELDVSGFDTSNVDNMGGMFNGCDELISLDLRNFDTVKVTNMSDMFSMCSELTDLDLSSFDTSNVQDMSFMFSYLDLETLELSHFDTSKVTSMSYMFSGSDKLESVDLRGVDTSQVSRMTGMFSGCKNLNLLQGIEDWDTSSVQYYDSFMDEGVLINGEPWEKMFQ